MKLSTNHSNEKVAWLDGLQRVGQSGKSSSPQAPPCGDNKLSTGSPWVERQPTQQIPRCDSKSGSPGQVDSGTSPPNSATSKNSTATSGIHSQVRSWSVIFNCSYLWILEPVWFQSDCHLPWPKIIQYHFNLLTFIAGAHRQTTLIKRSLVP